MPVKSHSNTKKKKSLTNTQKKKSGSNKSGTAKRSKNMSRKGGAKTKDTSAKKQKTAAKKKTTAKKSPSPESSGDDEDNYFYQIFTEDGRVKRHNVEVDTFATLPTPKYTAESKKEKDIEMYEKAINRFYNERADVHALKAKPTDTKKQREKKKQKFATFPKLIEDSIFNKIEKEMQPELDKWDEQKAIRDEQFGELTDKIAEASRRAGRIDYDMEQAIDDEFDWVNREWKPEEYPHKDFRLDEIENREARVRAAYHDDGPVAQGDEYNPRTNIESVGDTRIGNLSNYIQTKWMGWEDAKLKPGRKMTDMMVEDFSIPGVVADLDHEENVWEWETNNMEIYDIQRWNAVWEKANNEEYNGSAEEEQDIKDQMNKTNKDRATVVSELNKNIKTEAKIRADDEEKEKRKIAADAARIRKDEEAANKPSKKQLMRQRMKAAAQKESATHMPPPAPAQKMRATPMPPPAPAQKETASAIKRISWAEASTQLGKANFEMIFWDDYPNRMGLQNTDNGDTWLINEESKIHRDDADNAIKDYPERYEEIMWTYKEYTGPYLKNKETNRLSRIFG